MGASKNEFMNCRMSTEFYHSLDEQTKEHIEVRTVDITDFDYSASELWQSKKKASDKAFKELKKEEFNIRNNIKK